MCYLRGRRVQVMISQHLVVCIGFMSVCSWDRISTGAYPKLRVIFSGSTHLEIHNIYSSWLCMWCLSWSELLSGRFLHTEECCSINIFLVTLIIGILVLEGFRLWAELDHTRAQWTREVYYNKWSKRKINTSLIISLIIINYKLANACAEQISVLLFFVIKLWMRSFCMHLLSLCHSLHLGIFPMF